MIHLPGTSAAGHHSRPVMSQANGIGYIGATTDQGYGLESDGSVKRSVNKIISVSIQPDRAVLCDQDALINITIETECRTGEV